MSLQTYAFLHTIGVVVTLVGVTHLLFDPAHARRWPAALGLSLLFLTGAAQTLRLGYTMPPMWVATKVLLWGLVVAVAVFAHRFLRWGALLVVCLLSLAAVLSYVRPVGF